jgi:hypothetical protein
MLEYQRLVDEIQSAVYSLGTADPDLLREVAAQYAEACELANQRLRSCRQLLKQGLRGEAIQLAEQQPNLLDFVSMLDFPELPQWNQILYDWQMAVPPQLRIDVASELNEAYTDQQPLQLLLRNHRLLALGRAPLAGRIAVLRRIQQADPLNHTWQDDLRDWEKVRLKQLSSEAERAFTGQDGAALAALLGEVESSQWSIPPANEIVQRIRNAFQHISVAQARTEVEALEYELIAAYSAFDVEAGQAARKSWLSLAAIANVTPGDPLYESALPALDWLEEQDRLALDKESRDRAIQRLTQALDDGEPREKLEKLYHAAIRSDQPLPKLLESRLRNRLASFDLGSKRKQRLIVLGVVGLVILAGSAIAGLIFMQKHFQEIAAAAEGLHRLTEEQRFEEATKFYEQLEASAPRIAASAEVQQRKGELEGAKGEEQERAVAFNESFAAAEAAGLERPNRAALEKSRELASTAEEKSRVSKLEVKIAETRRKAQQQRDTAFATDLDALNRRLVALETGEPDSDANQSIQLLLDDLRLLSNRGLVSESVKQPVVALRTRVLAVQNDLGVRRQRAIAHRAITQALGNVPSYVESLKNFNTAFPATPQVEDFKQAIEERHLWDGTLAWQELMASGQFSRLRNLTSEEASSLLSQGRALVALYDRHPARQLFQEREKFIESLVFRSGQEGQKLKGSLLALLQDPLVKNVYAILTKEGDRYYCLDEPDLEKTDPVNILYVVDFTLDTRGKLLKRDTIASLGLAAQSKVASQMSAKLKSMKDADWEATFYGLVQLLQNDKDMDPILKFLLLKKTLAIGTTVSPVLAVAFAAHQKVMDEADVDTSANWLLPEDNDVARARIAAAQILTELPALSEVADIARTELLKLGRAPAPGYEWVGWLGRGLSGDWECHLSAQLPASKAGSLLVVSQSDDTSQMQFSPIGRLEEGKSAIDCQDVTRLLQGRPVFLLEDKPVASTQQQTSAGSPGEN